jgi:hypothetical protein
MRYYEFRPVLLEYDLNKTLSFGKNFIGNILKILRLPDSHDNRVKIVHYAEMADPTIKKSYVNWIIREASRIVDNQPVVRLNEDYEIIKEWLTRYVNLFKKNKLSGSERNIENYTYRQLKDMIEGKMPKSEENIDISGLNFENIGDMKIWYRGNDGILVSPLSLKAAQELGKGTDWCTTKPNNFAKYTEGGYLYDWIGSDGEKIQFHLHTNVD